MNLGLRYDIAIPAYSVDNYWGVMDLSYPGYRLVMPGLTPGTHIRHIRRTRIMLRRVLDLPIDSTTKP
jgi:hypothetical protein